MRFRLIGVAVATLVLEACGSQCGVQPASSTSADRWCNRTNEPHYAYVVVQHMSGVRVVTCVNFTPSFIDGVTALSRADIEFQAQRVGAATVVCQIDREPASTGDCGGQALGRWVTFVASDGVWRQQGVDLSKVRLYNAQAIGWRYIAAWATPSPPNHL